MSIDKLDKRTIKIKPIDAKTSTYTDFGIKINEKDPEFKVGDHVRISKYKTFLLGLNSKLAIKSFFWLQRSKMLYRGHSLLVFLNDWWWIYYWKILWKRITKKRNQADFRVENVIKKKGEKLYVKSEDHDSVGLINKMPSNKMSQYFSKPFERPAGNIKVKLNLSNYVTKIDFKESTAADASKLAAIIYI